MSINRLTKKRLFEDEALFNKLLPFARFDHEYGIFIHSDASLWSLFELTPLILSKIGDEEAFGITKQIQELFDSLDPTVSIQMSWITTFDSEKVLVDCLEKYPRDGAAGWMAHRWVRSMKNLMKGGANHRRPRRLRLVIGFRFDPPWRARGILEQITRTAKLLLTGNPNVTTSARRAEFEGYAKQFQNDVRSKAAKLSDIGLRARQLDGQDIIDIIYPLLNRKSTRPGKAKRGRTGEVPVPRYDPIELLANQLSETPVFHPHDGIVEKDGRFYRSISMTRAPRACFPYMITPLQSMPFENILTVTLSKDTYEKQLSKLDAIDTMMGLRLRNPLGRSNQKVEHQIRSVRSAREELYNGASQIVRTGVHQTFICQSEDEAHRAASEAIATMTQMQGARGMAHDISDLALMLHTLPGCYDPATDGPGWTQTLQSSRASRLFPIWGNWRGSQGSQFVLPSLWNRELVGFDLYDSNVAPNTLISGVSGAGKSYLLCYILITMNRGHFATLADGKKISRAPITFVFDKGMTGQPCGFDKVARLFGGKIYEATPSKAPSMNFLARLGETPPDPMNDDYKDLLDMCADIICDMASETNKATDRLEKTAVTETLVEAHRMYRSGPMKRELVLSDVVSILRAPKRVDEFAENAMRRNKIATLMSEYYGDGTYARFFDRPGALKLKERFIVFDLKALSRNPDLQRVFLKVAMLWADTVMNDPKELDARKILVFDEAHDLIGKTSANTIETAFRLYRKRKGIVIAASQSGEDFYVGSGGQAIVQNSAHKIFLRQDPTKFHMTAEAFNLSQQQQNMILGLKTIKGVESQFYLTSDIGEGALALPLEPAFYWASTNNGDDNQLFAEVLARCDGDFMKAFQSIVLIAPGGAGGKRLPLDSILPKKPITEPPPEK